MNLRSFVPSLCVFALLSGGCAVEQASDDTSDEDLRGASASDDLGAANDSQEFENRMFRTYPVGGPRYDLRSINVAGGDKVVAEVLLRPVAPGVAISAKAEVLLLNAQMRIVARAPATAPDAAGIVLRYQPRSGGKVYLAVREQSGADMPYAVRFSVDASRPTNKLTGAQVAALVRTGAATRRSSTQVESRGLERECAPGSFGPLACDSWSGAEPGVANFANAASHAGTATLTRTSGTPKLSFVHNDGEYDRELSCTFDAPDSSNLTCIFTADETVLKGTFAKDAVTLVEVSPKANRATRGGGRTFWSERESRVTVRFPGLLP
jgi:hypothetical protein